MNKKKLKLLLSKEEARISKASLAVSLGGILLFNNLEAIKDIYIKAAHQHNLISNVESCSISTEAGFDYGGIDWSDVNWFDNVALKCSLAKKWHNIVSYGWCCGYTFTWNDITR